MFSLNNRLVIGSISGLISIGLGYYILKNYKYHLSCPHHKCEHVAESCKNTQKDIKSELPVVVKTELTLDTD